MPRKKRPPASPSILNELNPKEARAVELVANGQYAGTALIEAGFSQSRAKHGLGKKLRRAADLLHAERCERFEIESDDLARRLGAIVWDDTEKTRDQIQAARLLADMMGLTKHASIGIRLNLDAAREQTQGLSVIEMLELRDSPTTPPNDETST